MFSLLPSSILRCFLGRCKAWGGGAVREIQLILLLLLAEAAALAKYADVPVNRYNGSPQMPMLDRRGAPPTVPRRVEAPARPAAQNHRLDKSEATLNRRRAKSGGRATADDRKGRVVAMT
jgi:hypothetical protein